MHTTCDVGTNVVVTFVMCTGVEFGGRSADIRVGQTINAFVAVHIIIVCFVGFRTRGRGGSFARGIATNGGFYTVSGWGIRSAKVDLLGTDMNYK